MSLVWKFRRKGSNIWYLTYSQDIGKPSRSLRITDERLAEVIRAKEENSILLGRHGVTQGPVQKVRFTEAAALFLRKKQTDGKKPNTIEAYTYALDSFGESLGRDEWVHKIKEDQLAAFKERRFLAGKKPKTIRNELVTLRTFFRFCQRSGFTPENPAERIELPSKPRRIPKYLHPDHFLKLMALIPDERFRLVIKFYILTGAREDEGTRIRKEHIDLDQGILIIPTPKPVDQEDKAIPIEEELRGVLTGLLGLMKPGEPRLVPYSPDYLNKLFKRYCKAAGLPSYFTWHSLRHTGATWLARSGGSLQDIQNFLGASLEVAQIYVHTVNEDLRTSLKKLQLPIPAKTKNPSRLPEELLGSVSKN